MYQPILDFELSPAFRLRMHFRVAIHPAGGSLKDLRLGALGQPQHIDRAVHAGLGGLHRIKLVVNRRRWTGQVVDLVHLNIERKGNIVAHELEVRVIEQMGDVVLGAGEEVVQTDDVMSVVQKALAQMRAEKAGAASDKDAGTVGVVFHSK